MALSIHPLEEFAQIISPPARLAALDIGTRTIGIAISTPDWRMTTPLKTIRRGKWTSDLAALEKAFAGHDIRGLAVGLPFNMDGSEGPRAQGVRQIIYNLIKTAPAWLEACCIVFIDERMSTAAAHETLSRQVPFKINKAKGALDAIAAQVILDRAIKLLFEKAVQND